MNNVDIRTALNEMKVHHRFEAKRKVIGEKVRCLKEPPKNEGEEPTYFVYAKGKKSWGIRYDVDTFLGSFDPIIKSDEQVTKEWHKRIRRALGEIDKSGLWRNSTMENVLRTLLCVPSYAEYKQIIRTANLNADMSGYMKKYPSMFAVEAGKLTPKFNWAFESEVAECKLKTMYFGKYQNDFYKREIAEAIQTGRSYSTGRVRASYDVSADIDFSGDYPCGWYSEEYRNTGNGHYYYMLSDSCVIYSEDD